MRPVHASAVAPVHSRPQIVALADPSRRTVLAGDRGKDGTKSCASLWPCTERGLPTTIDFSPPVVSAERQLPESTCEPGSDWRPRIVLKEFTRRVSTTLPVTMAGWSIPANASPKP